MTEITFEFSISHSKHFLNLKYSVTVIEHMYKQNKNILMTWPSNVASLEVYSLAASEPNKPRNFLWSADVNINASLQIYGGSTVVEHLPWHSKVGGLSPATASGTESREVLIRGKTQYS